MGYESRLENGAWVTGQFERKVSMGDFSQDIGGDEPVIIRSADQLEAVQRARVNVAANTATQAGIVAEILNERSRQDEKWGPVPRLNHTFGRWLKILLEEIGEACEADLEITALDETGWMEIEREDWVDATDAELTQAAAVLVAWLEHRAAIREQQTKFDGLLHRAAKE